MSFHPVPDLNQPEQTAPTSRDEPALNWIGQFRPLFGNGCRFDRRAHAVQAIFDPFNTAHDRALSRAS